MHHDIRRRAALLRSSLVEQTMDVMGAGRQVRYGKVRLVPLGSLFWAHPGAVPFPPHQTYTGPTQYMSMSDVACEGSHMRNFGRLVVASTLYPPPFKGVVPTQHSSTLGLGPYCGLTVH